MASRIQDLGMRGAGVPISYGQSAAPQGAGVGGQDRLPMWATSQQGYGSSFDNLFALAEPAGLRFGVPQVGTWPGIKAHGTELQIHWQMGRL